MTKINKISAARKNNKSVGMFKFGSIYYPKKDAKTSMIFQVTKENVKQGIASNPNACVLAHAIRRTYGDVHVSRTRAMLLKPINGIIYAVRYNLGEYSKKAVASLDEGKGFPVGTYKLNPPYKRDRIGVKRTDNRKNHKSKKILNIKITVRHYLRLQTAAI